MSTIAIPGGTFSTEPHEYRDERGVWIPSLTQVLKLQGLSDYSGVDQAVLENAARRGTEVHSLAAAYNQFGEVDPSWITDECLPYFDALMAFYLDTKFIPDPEWSEKSLIATIHGMKCGVTPDCHGRVGKDRWIVEFKCTSTRQKYWSIQTALQECAVYNSNHCGRVRRFALMLKKDGTYNLGAEHTNHEEDLANGVAALRNVWWRINSGQRVWEKM